MDIYGCISKFVMKQNSMLGKMRLIVLCACLLSSLGLRAQNQYGSHNVKIYCVEANGQLVEPADTLEAGVEYVGSAPLSVVCESHIEGPEGMTWRCEWNMSKQPDFSDNELVRFEDDTEIDFYDSGAYYIRLLVTYTYADGKEVTDESEPYIVRISESELHVPNAFSPNGDGINDVFKVTYQSLVSFNAYIFNRWGQQVYHWGLEDIDNGWDGTYKGKQVKEGVYFIVVEAEGSDGIKYKHKGDITVLRGYTETGSMAGGE